jgi:alkylation response protein AidB-like acyl-CoA dehydrogenase
MNFDFSDEVKQLQDQARRFLGEHATLERVREVLDGAMPFRRDLWDGMAKLGWQGAAIPEEFGGAGLGYEALCVLAEELGRSLAPVPFASSVYLASEIFFRGGSDAQRRRWLPQLATGKKIGTVAWAEGAGNPDPRGIKARVIGGRLTGSKWPVADGGFSEIAVVAARGDDDRIVLAVADLRGEGVRRTDLKTIDPTKQHARIEFDRTQVEVLGGTDDGWALLQHVLDRAAVLVAFEQVGGAAACLAMATDFAKQRYAFGRPIGSFQAIKHKLADVYIATELARSNAYYGAWALSRGAAELPLAAAAARVSATEAFYLAAKENIQTHGGMGFTWAADPHLFYRRAKLLALTLGSASHWKNRLVAELEMRNAA